jgi:hypothetical protein
VFGRVRVSSGNDDVHFGHARGEAAISGQAEHGAERDATGVAGDPNG